MTLNGNQIKTEVMELWLTNCKKFLPDAVSGDKDAEEMQGVDYSKIVPLLVKSIQELKAEVDLLKQECKCKN